MADERNLIVGLGNPGPRYAGTRHNVGFLVADLLAERLGGKFKAHRSRSGPGLDIVEGRLGGHPVVIAKPRSFMNESGGPVSSVAKFFKVPLERITVVHDELDLPWGALRVKRGGGDGGHNGLRSITSALGPDYNRVRFGIGRPPGRQDPAEFVLRDFAAAERKDLGFFVDRTADAVEHLIANGLEPTQNEYNGA